MQPSIQPPYSTSFDGIITSLNNNFKDWDQYIKITPSSTNEIEGRDEANGLINRSLKGDAHIYNWCSKAEDKPSIILSFTKFYIVPSFYSLQSKTQETLFPISWIVEASLDNKTWELIDTKENITELLDEGKSYTFTFEKTSVFRHFKITQTKTNTKNSKSFCLRSVELFGTIQYSLRTVFHKHSYLQRGISFILFIA